MQTHSTHPRPRPSTEQQCPPRTAVCSTDTIVAKAITRKGTHSISIRPPTQTSLGLMKQVIDLPPTASSETLLKTPLSAVISTIFGTTAPYCGMRLLAKNLIRPENSFRDVTFHLCGPSTPSSHTVGKKLSALALQQPKPDLFWDHFKLSSD